MAYSHSSKEGKVARASRIAREVTEHNILTKRILGSVTSSQVLDAVRLLVRDNPGTDVDTLDYEDLLRLLKPYVAKIGTGL